jgi:hypothetical protein
LVSTSIWVPKMTVGFLHHIILLMFLPSWHNTNELQNTFHLGYNRISTSYITFFLTGSDFFICNPYYPVAAENSSPEIPSSSTGCRVMRVFWIYALLCWLQWTAGSLLKTWWRFDYFPILMPFICIYFFCNPFPSEVALRYSALCIQCFLRPDTLPFLELLLQYGLLIRAGFWFSARSLGDWPLLMCW